MFSHQSPAPLQTHHNTITRCHKSSHALRHQRHNVMHGVPGTQYNTGTAAAESPVFPYLIFPQLCRHHPSESLHTVYRMPHPYATSHTPDSHCQTFPESMRSDVWTDTPAPFPGCFASSGCPPFAISGLYSAPSAILPGLPVSKYNPCSHNGSPFSHTQNLHIRSGSQNVHRKSFPRGFSPEVPVL